MRPQGHVEISKRQNPGEFEGVDPRDDYPEDIRLMGFGHTPLYLIKDLNRDKKQLDFPECIQCYNGGTVVKTGHLFGCDCPDNYFGDQCETQCPSSFLLLDNGVYYVGCFKFLLAANSWYDAPAACKRFDSRAQLVVLNSADKNKAVKDYLRTIPSSNTAACKVPWGTTVFWSAGSRRVNQDCSSPFVWKPASGAEQPMSFSDFESGQPDCSSSSAPAHEPRESCALLYSTVDYRWNDFPCDWPVCAVCEIPVGA